MGKLHLIGGEKGGVGKSFTARLLAQYLIDNNKPFAGFDSDQSHQTFSRFYSEFNTSVTPSEIESLDQIIETAEENSDLNIVVDLAAQTAEKIASWMDSCDLVNLMEELDYETYLWHVMDDSADCVNLLAKTLERFADTNVKLVVVQNYGRGNSFKQFEQTAVYQKAKQQGAIILMIARLHENITQKIDFSNLSFWAAANSKEQMKIAERQRVKVWLRHSYGQMERVFNNGNAQNTQTVNSQVTEAQQQAASSTQPLHAIKEKLEQSEKEFC